MDKRAPYAVAAVVVIAAAAVAVFLAYGSGYGNGTGTTTVGSSRLTTVESTATTTQPAAQNGTMSNSTAGAALFNSTQYYAHSYLISGGANLSGSPATSDFSLSAANDTNGSITYTLSFAGSHSAYRVVIKPGDGLYYIDMVPSDDSGSEHYTGDDGYAVVNASGYVVELNYPISG